MNSPNPERIRNAANIALIVVFFFLIWIPLADSFLHFDPAPMPNEKRALATFPQFQRTLAGCREYVAGQEKYFNDHFGFRKTLLRWEHIWKRGLFRESPLSEVMIGQDGWLYLARPNMVDNIIGGSPYNDERLKAWQTLLERRRDWCASRGIAYLFVIAPEKHSIYPEHLPAWLATKQRYDQIGQIVSYLKTNSTVPVLDLRLPLLRAKETARTFLVTDSHWNAFGAFTAYQSLIEALATQRPGMKPLPLDAFEMKLSQQPGGDLAVMLGQEQAMVEKDFVTLMPRPPLEFIKTVPDPSLFVKAHKKDTDPTIRASTNPAARGKAILFRDSFAEAWEPFLGQHFNQVIYVWQHEWDIGFLEQQKPDVVIDEEVERLLYRNDPRTWKDE